MLMEDAAVGAIKQAGGVAARKLVGSVCFCRQAEKEVCQPPNHPTDHSFDPPVPVEHVIPPSTTKEWPVTYFAASLARNTTAFPTSHDSPIRPIGTLCSVILL